MASRAFLSQVQRVGFPLQWPLFLGDLRLWGPGGLQRLWNGCSVVGSWVLEHRLAVVIGARAWLSLLVFNVLVQLEMSRDDA